jgi:hypothetical protein
MKIQKFTKVGAPCVKVLKKTLVHIIRILPPSFRHILCGKILFVNKNIFWTTTSFVAIVIMGVIMGNKLNIAVTELMNKTQMARYNNYLYNTENI